MQEIRSTVFSLTLPEGDTDSFRLRELCERRKGIKDYAIILHDKDVRDGKPILPHWHILVRGDNKLSLSSIANLFEIRREKIQRGQKGGTKGFNAGLMYLLHLTDDCKEQCKYVYSFNEVISNIDVEGRIKKILECKKKGSYINQIRELAFKGDMNPEKISKEYKLDIKHIPEVMKYYELGKKSRRESRAERKLSKFRINIYVYGLGGVGKTTLCDCIAKLLYPDMIMEDIVFNTSSSGSTIRDYADQPVLIWDDIRPENIVSDLGGRSNFLRIFRPNPRPEKVNVKYGSITLTNKYNLVNSYMSFGQFIGKISGNEDKNQYLRRFPIVIHILEEKIKIYYLGKFLNPSLGWGLNLWREIDCNLPELAYSLADEEFVYLTGRILSPLLELIREMEKVIEKKTRITNGNEKEKIFERYGVSYSDYLESKNERLERAAD